MHILDMRRTTNRRGSKLYFCQTVTSADSESKKVQFSTLLTVIVYDYYIYIITFRVYEQ